MTDATDSPHKADTKSAKTRERILDATASVLSTKGYAGTRLSDVAEVAGLQPPTIYYHFESRETLIEEVMFTGMTKVKQHVESRLDEVPDSASALDRILVAVREHLLFELQESNYTMATIRNAGQLPESISHRSRQVEVEYGLTWRSLFRNARASGELQDGMNDQMARMFVIGAINWAVEWWSVDKGSYDELGQQTQGFVRRAIAAR